MKLALIQISSRLNPEEHLPTLRTFLAAAKKQGAQAAFLPEVFYSISNGLTPTPYLVASGNEHERVIQKLATDSGLWLMGGSVAFSDQGKIKNRAYVISPEGDIKATYDKKHLFRVDLSDQSTSKIVDETKIYSAGDKTQLFDFGPWKIGLGICFDLRFPEMWRFYFSQGANLLSIPSAFTVPTGKAHWHTLMRARAIENQAYVIASAQVGQHNERISTYGHSLVIDPWGEILCDLGEQETFQVIELNLERVHEVRGRMAVPFGL